MSMFSWKRIFQNEKGIPLKNMPKLPIFSTIFNTSALVVEIWGLTWAAYVLLRLDCEYVPSWSLLFELSVSYSGEFAVFILYKRDNLHREYVFCIGYCWYLENQPVNHFCSLFTNVGFCFSLQTNQNLIDMFKKQNSTALSHAWSMLKKTIYIQKDTLWDE